MPGRNDYPDVGTIRKLPELGSQEISAEWEDQNGHVNVGFYMSMYNESGWAMMKPVGVDETYFAERKMGLVDLENHFRYLSELHVGDRVTMYGRFLGYDSKRIHGIALIVNDSTDVLAGTIEFLSINLDLQKRRVTEIPQDIADRLSEITREQQQIEWTIPERLSIPG